MLDKKIYKKSFVFIFPSDDSGMASKLGMNQMYQL